LPQHSTPEPEDARPDSGAAPEPVAPRARHRRRVTTDPPLGTDLTPAPEPPKHVRGENDERMRMDKPPHY
jgi:hypothetical protein